MTKQAVIESFGDRTSASQGAVAGAFVTLIWGCAEHYFGAQQPPPEIYGASLVVVTWAWQLLVK